MALTSLARRAVLRTYPADQRTLSGVRYEAARVKALVSTRLRRTPDAELLHLGCGGRRVEGWLNCDLSGSDYDIDLMAGRLPFRTGSVRAVVMQHVIEHLELREHLLPLLSELRRVLTDDGAVWLSCPDLEKVCVSYVEDRGRTLLEDRRSRYPAFTLGGVPTQHIVNDLFHQRGGHRNLFDFDLLAWALEEAGFSKVERVKEGDLLSVFPEFPERRDDAQSLYVVAQP
ncbi:methyltransferase domain-containing protein [Streptomyces sp. YC504]|uniref:Methyltransferase domain-containing protein n=1 Tax=Streptomyces mesophilus TaxID=1775132 RepID=A0A6G4XQG1_9ACTN|nr:methyltransferase domain-containing protein [Streptomyces mesophilus]NGO79795.1 methyltransferase domain-containing protein [Streptomyces mesophilus]